MTNLVPLDILAALDELGIEYSTSGEEAKALCPDPDHDDTTPSWNINLDSGMHHCLGGETRIITWEGVKPIRELSGKTVRLLTSSGWTDAPVMSFGVQPLYELILSRNGVKKIIRTTAGHRWLTRTTTKVTTQLTTGHRLKSRRSPGGHNLVVSHWGVGRGFTFGDGTVGATSARVTCWGEKDKALLEYLPGPSRLVTTENGVKGTEISGLPRYFKTDLPDISIFDPSYLYGWLAGYFAADGNVSEAGVPTLSSSNEGQLLYIRDLCTKLGIFTYGVRYQDRVGIHGKMTRQYSVTFSRQSLTADFFLVDQHRVNWLAHKTVRERPAWVVESVRALNISEEVFCAQVPGDHNFTLEDNILTGNCFSCGFGGSFRSLVMAELGVNRADSEIWIKQRKVKDIADGKVGRKADRKKHAEITAADLWEFDTDYPEEELEFRGFDYNDARWFNLLWDHKRDGWIIPFHDVDDRFIGYQFKPRHGIGGTPLNHPPHLKKSGRIFESLSFIEGELLIIVESPLDVLRLYAMGYENVVALFGASMDAEQAELIIEKFNKVILFFDDDEAGRKGITRALTLLKGVDVHVFAYTETQRMGPYYVHAKVSNLDPGDLDSGEVTKGITRATPGFRTGFM